MTQTVLLKITAMFLVICVGWVARRRGYLATEFTAILSRLVVDVAYPCLVFTQMLRTTTPAALRAEWFSPVLCGAVIVLAYAVGALLAPLVAGKGQRNTFVFLVATPNWIFLPLPIVTALYGDDGVRTVLLCNVGAQLMLWSFGVWILHGAVRTALKNLLTNTGLWATAAGVVAPLCLPSANGWEAATTGSAGGVLGSAVVQAMAMVGSLTIPLSLLAIGAQLGELTVPVHHLSRALWGVVLGRLLIAPAVTIALVVALGNLGWTIPEVPRMVGYLIAAMPVGISSSVIVTRFAGDAGLAAQGIFYSTFFSLMTVPVIFYLIQQWRL